MSDINVNPDTPEIRSGTFIRTADGTGWVPIPEPDTAISAEKDPPAPATRTAPNPVIRPGVQTSEFLISMAGIIAATVLLILHRITPSEWTTMTGINASVYTIGRSILKGWSGAQS